MLGTVTMQNLLLRLAPFSLALIEFLLLGATAALILVSLEIPPASISLPLSVHSSAPLPAWHVASASACCSSVSA